MVHFKDLPGNVYHAMAHIFKNTTFRRGAVALIFLVILTGLISINFTSNRVTLKVGQVAPKDILAPRGIEFEDKVKTAEAKRRAVEAVQPAYDPDLTKNDEALKETRDIFAKIRDLQKDTTLNLDSKVSNLKQYLGFSIDDAILVNILQVDEKTLSTLEGKTNAILSKAMEEKVADTALDDVKDKMSEEVNRLPYNRNYKQFINTILQNMVRPNQIFNKEKTEDRINAAESSVTPYIVAIKQGQKIIGQGEIVTKDHISKLQALGLLKPQTPFNPVLGTAILVLAGMMLVMIYLYQYRRDYYNNDKYLLLLGIIAIIIMIIAKVVIAVQIPHFSSLWGYLVPLASASMLIAVLLDSRLAILVTAILSVYLGIMTGEQLRFCIVALLGGLTAVYSVSKLSQSSDLVKAGLYVSAANLISITGLGLVSNTALGDVLFGLGLGLANGIFSGVLTNGTLPYMESAFGITSAIKFLELSNPNHPLLKSLLVEAPGTYHHSIIVGNLAEAAADAVGGDSLLVRVGAYYHDIGKIKRPYFFIENQLMEENPHDKLAPTLSTLIITSHIKDGVEMAREHNLPEMLVNIIEQHHGNGLVTYFYNKAMENDKNETFTEADFRYEAPKPKSKEAALVMLADSVEAAVRSLNKPTPGRVEGVIRKIIKDKLNDGQLDECDLTFKDLDSIANAFLRVLGGIFHSRIEYPDFKEMEKKKLNGTARK